MEADRRYAPTHMKKEDRIAAFVHEIWSWYVRHKRQLPWRDLPDTDPNIRAYKILISEVMLQQTQVSRVIIVFKRFLEEFPTMESLARASNKDVILAWRGMGYNSRALRLRDAIKMIVEGRMTRPERPLPENKNFLSPGSAVSRRGTEGIFPRTMDELLSIPGIGHYTAGAVMNFAFGTPVHCIDTNIRRILHRGFEGPETGDGVWEKSDRELLPLAADVLAEAVAQAPGFPELVSPPGAEWHAALMDFGSLVQTKRSPRWDICPLTAKGIMATTEKSWDRAQKVIKKKPLSKRKEPGRIIAGAYVPNRIIRGRVVELLRDAKTPVTLETIGRNVCIDWSASEHREWLNGIVTKLTRDAIVARQKRGFVLQS